MQLPTSGPGNNSIGWMQTEMINCSNLLIVSLHGILQLGIKRMAYKLMYILQYSSTCKSYCQVREANFPADTKPLTIKSLVGHGVAMFWNCTLYMYNAAQVTANYMRNLVAWYEYIAIYSLKLQIESKSAGKELLGIRLSLKTSSWVDSAPMLYSYITS